MAKATATNDLVYPSVHNFFVKAGRDGTLTIEEIDGTPYAIAPAETED